MSRVYISDFEKKKKFLLEHEEFFLNSTSVFFNLSREQLVKYKPILNWHNISNNRSIKWNTDIVDEFKNEIFIKDGFFPEFNLNDSLPWSIEFIERYENLWSWQLLAQNEYVMGNVDIKNHFYTQLYPYTEVYVESCTHIFNGLNHKGQTYGEEIENDCLPILENHKELQFQHPIEIDVAESIDWLLLSQNEILPWNAELIEEYYDKWNWSALSTNPSIPWDLNLIKKFEDKIDWSVDVMEIVDGLERISFNMRSISVNQGIKWDTKLFSAFVKKLNPWDISINQNVKWDIDLLTQFDDFWEYSDLSRNRAVWEKVLLDFNTPEHLNPLLDMILDKRKV